MIKVDDNLLWEAMLYQLDELDRPTADQFEQSLVDDERILALAHAVDLDLAVSDALCVPEQTQWQSATAPSFQLQTLARAGETREAASRFAVIAAVLSVSVAAVLLICFRSDTQPASFEAALSQSEFPYELIWNDQIADENLALSLNEDLEPPVRDELLETDLIAGVPEVPSWMLAAVSMEEATEIPSGNQTEAN